MHTHDLSHWTHSHRFDLGNPAAERGTRAVLWITAATMVLEAAAGWWFNSMALLADGLHMGSHAAAIGLSTFAYAAARRYARDARFAFGTWKIEVLAGFASAVILLGIAALMAVASVERLLDPQAIHYREALAVAVLGLLVNAGCALILSRAQHDHARDHAHGHVHHHDLNLKSAYVHVVADAATSVLAIAALAGGWMFGWGWLDPVMGLAGGALVALWAWGLLRDTGRVLLDREMDHPVAAGIRAAVDSLDPRHETRIADLHVWRVGKSRFACILSLVTHDAALTPDAVKGLLARHDELAHVTVEINVCAPG